MTDMWDAHVALAGYRESPLDGEVFSPAYRTFDLLRTHGISGFRHIGVPGEFLAYRRVRPVERMVVATAGPYLDSDVAGFRDTRVCRDRDAVDRAVAIAVLDGCGWVTVGAGLEPELAAHAVAVAHRSGLSAAVEAGPAVHRLVAEEEPPDSVEGLLGLLTDSDEPADAGRPHWSRVAALAEEDIHALSDRAAACAARRVPIVPMLLRLRRACRLDEAVTAPGLAELCDVLPYHRYLAELRNPAAMRFGRRHANRYLGYERLDREQRRAFDLGWEKLLGVLRLAGDGGAVLAGGSGAPATGLSPGFALHEEARVWRGAGLGEHLVATAFGETARQLVEGRRMPCGVDGDGHSTSAAAATAQSGGVDEHEGVQG